MNRQFKFGDVIYELPKSKRKAKDANKTGAFPFFVCSSSIKRSDFDDYADEAIILSTGGSAYVHYCDTNFSASGDTWVLATDQERLDTKYAYYCLEFKKQKIEEDGFQGSGLKHLRKDYIRDMSIILPPLHEQKKISEILSGIDSVSAYLSKKLYKIVNLKTSVEASLFRKHPNETGGECRWVRLDDVATFSQGVQVDVENHFSHKEVGRVRFVRISDYTKAGEEPRFIDQKYAAKGLVARDDVVMIRYGEAGRVCRGIEGAIANNLFTITPCREVSKDYLYCYLDCDNVQKDITKISASSAMPAINFRQLGGIEFKLVDEHDQARSVSQINSLQDEIDLLISQINRLSDLSWSVGSDLLSGRKRVSI